MDYYITDYELMREYEREREELFWATLEREDDEAEEEEDW